MRPGCGGTQGGTEGPTIWGRLGEGGTTRRGADNSQNPRTEKKKKGYQGGGRQRVPESQSKNWAERETAKHDCTTRKEKQSSRLRGKKKDQWFQMGVYVRGADAITILSEPKGGDERRQNFLYGYTITGHRRSSKPRSNTK